MTYGDSNESQSLFAGLPNRLIMDIIQINTQRENEIKLAVKHQADHKYFAEDYLIADVSYAAKEYWEKYNNSSKVSIAFKFHYWLVGTGTQTPPTEPGQGCLHQIPIPFYEFGGEWCQDCQVLMGEDDMDADSGYCLECDPNVEIIHPIQ
tara:strand:+ start:171 stop:620 length:450 start_codon:yes stop_codon:yes gene_type:complete